MEEGYHRRRRVDGRRVEGRRIERNEVAVLEGREYGGAGYGKAEDDYYWAHRYGLPVKGIGQ